MKDEVSKEELEQKISELEQTIRVLKTDLIHDSLTGLKTRKFFDEEARIYFNSAMHPMASTRKEWFGFRNLSFVFFDIDHFKSVNDTHGHMTGDGVLKAVAQMIQSGVRDGDIVARWGGEEIVVALVGANTKNAISKAESIRKSVERMAFNNVDGLHVTVSAGVATAEAEVSFEDTIARADEALYEAKESGRNKVVVFSDKKEE